MSEATAPLAPGAARPAQPVGDLALQHDREQRRAERAADPLHDVERARRARHREHAQCGFGRQRTTSNARSGHRPVAGR